MPQIAENDVFESLKRRKPDYTVSYDEQLRVITVYPPKNYLSNGSYIQFFFDDKENATFWHAGMYLSNFSLMPYTTADDISLHYISLTENWETKLEEEETAGK